MHCYSSASWNKTATPPPLATTTKQGNIHMPVPWNRTVTQEQGPTTTITTTENYRLFFTIFSENLADEGLQYLPSLWTKSMASNSTQEHFLPLTMHSPVARGRVPTTVGQHLQALGTLQHTHTHFVTPPHQIITIISNTISLCVCTSVCVCVCVWERDVGCIVWCTIHGWACYCCCTVLALFFFFSSLYSAPSSGIY